ncbi:hypothetical protein ABPG72_013485 [Tetrahymena utriculariae]
MATLGYWSFRGLAQPIRFLLAYLGVQYTDKHYTKGEDWFENDKKNLGMDFPNIPYFIDNDIKISESSAIPFYIIKKYNKSELLGQNADGSYNEREIKVQQVIGVIKDINKELMGLCFNPDFANAKDKVYNEKLSVGLKKLTDFLGNKEFLLGSLTYADFLFYETLSYYKHIFPQSITPTVANYLNRFQNLPGIKEYIAKPSVDLNAFLPPSKAAWHGPK